MKNCIDCGKSIWKDSIRCRNCKVIKSRKDSGHTFFCEQCGIEAHRRPGGRSTKFGAKNRWCSSECMRAWFAENKKIEILFSTVHRNICKQCNKEWISKRRKSFCSDECRELKRKEDYRVFREFVVSLKPQKKCNWCGVDFQQIRNEKYCSSTCRKQARKPENKKRTRYGITRKQWKRIRLRVLIRDNYLCHICGRLTNPFADVNDESYPNADHVEPVSGGGETKLENLKCACRSCDIKKGGKRRKTYPAGAIGLKT